MPFAGEPYPQTLLYCSPCGLIRSTVLLCGDPFEKSGHTCAPR